jgi:hypothetical protein
MINLIELILFDKIRYLFIIIYKKSFVYNYSKYYILKIFTWINFCQKRKINLLIQSYITIF